MAYEILKTTGIRQIELGKYFEENQNIRKKIGFADEDMPEDLHYEESFEFLIPLNSPIKVKIFQKNNSENAKGGCDLNKFEEVTVNIDQMLVIYPNRCHLVTEKKRFIVLKVAGKWKIVAKPNRKEPGCCQNFDCSLWDYCERTYLWNNILLNSFKIKLPSWYETCKSYVKPGPSRAILLKQSCPFCNQSSLYCCRNDFGHVDCEPRFCHICVNPSCKYVIETEIQGVSYPDIETRIDYCPWCS